MHDCSAEIYRQDGEAPRSIRIEVRPDASIYIDACDTGEIVKETWGDDDYEFWVDVPASECRKLLFALLREKYLGRENTVDEFRDFCKREAIEHNWDSYT